MKVIDLMTIVYQKFKILPKHQTLLCNGKQLVGSKRIQDYAIEEGTKIQLVKRLRGARE